MRQKRLFKFRIEWQDNKREKLQMLFVIKMQKKSTLAESAFANKYEVFYSLNPTVITTLPLVLFCSAKVFALSESL
jgi:hypothetical protein